MGKKMEFSGRSLDECIEKASRELNVPANEIKYVITEEKTLFFKKNVTIRVEEESIEEKKVPIESFECTDNNEVEEENNNNNQLVQVEIDEDNKVIKVNSKMGPGRKITIERDSSIELQVDGISVEKVVEVTPESDITYSLPLNKATREIDITVSEDKMKAFASLSYSPEISENIQYKVFGTRIKLYKKINDTIYPPEYTYTDIIEALKLKGITYGINKENINEMIKIASEKKKTGQVLVSQGKEIEESIDDEVKLYFETTGGKFESDESGNIDFKSIGNITSVNAGDLLAERIPGKDGENGINVFGQVVKSRMHKVIKLSALKGCELIDGLKVMATIGGKPMINGYNISVKNIYELQGDVDIKTGNISFVGDVIIYGDVKDGMSILSGRTVDVKSNVWRAQVKANDAVKIGGNVISSSITSGMKSIEKIKYGDALNDFKTQLESIKITIEQLKQFNVVKKQLSDKEYVKFIVENKFKGFKNALKTLMEIMESIAEDDSELYLSIKERKSDIYYLRIEKLDEIDELLELATITMDELSSNEEDSSNVFVEYVQDSVIQSAGSVFVKGKGVYKSTIIAADSIIFSSGASNVRGGVLKASNKIKVKTVGSIVGVKTDLIVGKQGHIYCDTAYINTKFVVGEREYVLEESSKNVHVYLDKDFELVVDKFKL